MANVTVTVPTSNITVDTTNSIVNVASTTSNVLLNPTAFVSNASVRVAISVSNESGFGNLAYDSTSSSNGIIQYTGVSTSDIRAQVSASTTGDGSLIYTPSTGIMAYTGPNSSDYRTAISVTDAGGDGSLAYNDNTGVLTYTGPSSADYRTAISVTDAGGDGSLTYNSSTGVLTYTGSSDADKNTWFATKTTDELTEGTTNLYYSNALVDARLVDYPGNMEVLDSITTSGNINLNADLKLAGNIISTAGPVDTLIYGNAQTNIDVQNYQNINLDTYGTYTGGGAAYGTINLKGDVTITEPNTGTNAGNLTVGHSANVGVRAIVGNVLQASGACTIINYGKIQSGYELKVSGNQVGNSGGNANIILEGVSQNMISAREFGAEGLVNGDANLHIAADRGINNFIYTDGASSGIGDSDNHFRVITGRTPESYINNPSDRDGDLVDIGADGSMILDINPRNASANDGYFRVYSDRGPYTLGTPIFSVDPTAVNTEGTVTINGNTSINGNLQVDGNIDYVNVVDLLVNDQSITLNYGNVAQDAMIIVDRTGAAGNNVDIKWNETTDKWQFTNDGTTYNNIPLSSITSVNGDTGPAVVLDTDDIDEGTSNLYYSNTRVEAYLTSGSTIATDGLTTLTINNSETVGSSFEVDGLGNVTVGLERAGGNDGRFVINGPGPYNEAIIMTSTGNITADSNISASYFIGDGSSITGLTTDIVTEGTNLYYTTDRANSAIDSYVLGSENITVTSGVLATTPALGNTNSLTAQSGSGLTFNSDDGTTVTSKFGVNSTVTETANIAGKGYGVFNFTDGTNTSISYSGTDSFEWYEIDGSVVLGSTTMTITSVVRGIDSTTAAVSDIIVGQVIANGTSASTPGSTDLTIFPDDAYVVSVNSGAGTVEMSKPAVQTTSFTHTTDGIILDAGLVDTTTGLVIKLLSNLRAIGSGSDSNLFFRSIRNHPFGYPATGPVPTDFDIITTGTASDYSMSLSAFMLGQTPITNDTTVLNAPLGITIGENTQLTNRGENDGFSSFGMNMMWDGLTSYSRNIQPQVLFKSYKDNTEQSSPTFNSSGAPRLFFSSANGNADANAFDAYPRTNQELGRLSFWGSTGEQLNPSSYNVPAFMSVGAADDWDTWNSGTAGNTNVYMGATSDGLNPDTYLSYKSGELFLGGGNNKPVTFAPAYNGSATSPQNAYAVSPTKWAEANYADTGTTAGAKFSVTNGGSAGAGTVGDMQLSLNRLDNTESTPHDLATIFSGSVISQPSDWICIRFTSAGTGGSFNNQVLTMSASGTITVSGTGNESALGGNQYGLTYLGFDVGGGAYLLRDTNISGIITYSSLGGTSPNASITQTTPSTMSVIVSSGVTAKEWKFNLEEQSDDLLIQSDGTTVMHFTDQRVFIDEVFRLHNLTTTEINALPSPQSGDTVYNTTLNQICFYNGTAWQKVTSATM